MPEKPSITSSEIGVLWLTYQQKTLLMRMLEYFINRADDAEAKELMSSLYDTISPYVTKITEIFEEEGAVIPVGYTPEDVNKDAPKLYDNGFDIMFVRLMKEISMGMHALNINMCYREDLVSMMRELTSMTQHFYQRATQYLLDKGMIARPPYVAMPKTVEFVEDKNYLDGLPLNPFKERRPLNMVEIGHIYHAIETNIIGMQMITGFAQCASNQDAKRFFFKGAELAKSIIREMSEILLEHDIQTPAHAGGNTTRSTEAPFSDKLMMYCTSLLCSFSIGGRSLGTAFSMRNDLPVKYAVVMKDILEYAHEGAILMIKNRWMEEPPQMVNIREMANV